MRKRCSAERRGHLGEGGGEAAGGGGGDAAWIVVQRLADGLGEAGEDAGGVGGRGGELTLEGFGEGGEEGYEFGEQMELALGRDEGGAWGHAGRRGCGVGRGHAPIGS